ncbi:MAG: alpha-mannosidase [Candidatus Hydrogenedentes bacterium]|nr:alpha-mannosidase [Candidatus Hydrogenedentota bacterium]
MIPPKTLEKLEKRLQKIHGWRYGTVQEVPLEYAETTEHYRTPPADLEYAPAPTGLKWGSHWGSAWFRGEIEVPRTCRGRRIFYRHESFCEKLLFVNGAIHSGINPRQNEALLVKSARGGERFSFYVEAYAGHPIPGVDAFRPEMYTHQFCDMDPGQDPPLELKASALVAERSETAALYYEASTLYDIAIILDKHSLRRAQILDRLNRALDLVPLEWEKEEDLESASKAARRELAPLLKLKNSSTTPYMGTVGHAHIDIAWLWPMKETIRKGARTFARVLELMDDYPDYRFQQSQPVLIDMIEKHYPELLPRIRKRVKEGRWEPNGGMWVEADCNLSGGEALVRQFLEGRKKTQEIFGYSGDTLWLPDVFGYAAALPQILKGCGIDNFVTSKINWNDTNRFPFDTFLWRGIDGTEIFSHFITTRTNGYNAILRPRYVWETWEYVQHKEVQDGAIVSVGYGDGGGGPTRDMCEFAQRMGDIEGCPRTEWVSTSAFLKKLREMPVERPRWVGELYLEYHRGTYTSQARTKRYNRKLEFLLREVELYSVLAMMQDLDYPAAQLQDLWRVVLTNQFHDILPGSSIRQVYEVAEAEYAQAEKDLLDLRDKALDTLSQAFVPDSENAARVIANALSWPREEIVYLRDTAANSAVDAAGRPLPAQRYDQGVAVRVSIDAFSITPIALRNDDLATKSTPFKISAKGLETPFFKVLFDKSGRISRLYDKEAGREVVREGGLFNAFYSAEDMPVFWDAWDIDRYYRDTLRAETELISREVAEEGPLFCAVRLRCRIGKLSSLVQDVIFYAHSRRIDFRTEIDWRERHTLLKVGFDMNVLADKFRCEIQYGHAERNTHANTSWDQAQFEVCAHKWVDISQNDYGVALLNDCKYGHDTLDDRLSLTLLKSSVCPDPEADQGRHEFVYALFPHTGTFTAETVVREGYQLNQPLTVSVPENSRGKETELWLCRVSNPNVVVEAVKKAEADNSLILRCYEAGKTNARTTITFRQSIRRASVCNMMEEQDVALPVEDDRITLDFRPFEIKTLKIALR